MPPAARSRHRGDEETKNDSDPVLVGSDTSHELERLVMPRSRAQDRKERKDTIPALAQCLEKTSNECSAQIADVKSDVVDQRTKTRDLEQQLEQARIQIAAFEERLLAQEKANADHMRATAASIAQIRADTNQAVNTLTAEVSMLTHKNHDLEQQLAGLRRPREIEHAQTQEQPDSLRQTVTGLTTRIEDVENLADNGSTEEPTVSAQHQIAVDVQRLSDQQWLENVRQSALDNLMEELRQRRLNHLE